MRSERTNAGRGPRLLGALALVALAGPAAAQVNTEYHAFRRMMPGGSRAEIQAAEAMGFQAFLDQQLLNYQTLPDAEGDGVVGSGPEGVREYWPPVTWAPWRIFNVYNSDQDTPRRYLRYARLWRFLFSEQGLYEHMTWFFENHFNIDSQKRAGWMLVPYFDRNVSRKHTFGQFRTMLLASAGEDDPVKGASAMLHYLDNLANPCLNLGDPVNENYAREVMELHGLGTKPQIYTEADVLSLAQILAGRNFNTTQGNQTFGMVSFDSMEHCNDLRDFLGMQFGLDDGTGSQGRAALNWIVTKQVNNESVCARFIACKLVAMFLTDAPNTPAQQAIVDGAVDDAVLAFGLDGDLTAMLQAILTEANIDGVVSGPDPALRYMSPWKFASSLLQAAEADVDPTNIDPLSKVIDGLGQKFFGLSPPIGFPLALTAWIQDQPGRWNLAFKLFEENPNPAIPNSTIPGVVVDVDALYQQLGGFDPGNAGAQASVILTGGTIAGGGNLNARDRLVLQLYSERQLSNGMAVSEVMWRLLALGGMAPSFSRY